MKKEEPKNKDIIIEAKAWTECDHEWKETDNGLYCFRCGNFKNTNWEEEFDKRFDNLWIYDGIEKSYTSCSFEVKDFISFLIAQKEKQAREECLEIINHSIDKSDAYKEILKLKKL